MCLRPDLLYPCLCPGAKTCFACQADADARALKATGEKDSEYADTEWFSVLIPEWVASDDVSSAAGGTGAGGTAARSDVVGSQRSPLVNLGQVFAGHLYRNRSFTIRNDSSVTLDFSVSSVLTDSGKHTASGSELTLSSSHMVLMLVRTLTLPPQTTKRVYIFYRPWPGVGAGCDGKREREGVREAFEVTVRCRLIKDHQKVCVCGGGGCCCVCSRDRKGEEFGPAVAPLFPGAAAGPSKMSRLMGEVYTWTGDPVRGDLPRTPHRPPAQGHTPYFLRFPPGAAARRPPHPLGRFRFGAVERRALQWWWW